MNNTKSMIVGLSVLLTGALLVLAPRPVQSMSTTFAPGDIFVSITVYAPSVGVIPGSVTTGQVQWRFPDGTLNRIMISEVPGTAEGMGFDAGANLYLTHWCFDLTCSSGAILKFEPGNAPIAFAVAPDNRGSFWIDLAADGCTIFYTSWGPNVKRFNTCTGVQLPNFNVAPLPGGEVQDLRILPDGGVLVSSGQVVARLDASGNLVQTYGVAGETSLWAGLDLVGDGTFWVGNYYTSNVYKFDLTTGAVRASFNTGTPPETVVGVRVLK